MALSPTLVLPFLLAQVSVLKKRRLTLLAIAICVPLAILGSLYLLASSVNVYAHVISIRVLGSEEGALLIEAEVGLNSTALVDVGLEEGVADLLVNGSVIGSAELEEPVALPVGREVIAKVKAKIWDLERLGTLIAGAISGRGPSVEARVRGRASAFSLPIWFERRMTLDVPLPRLELGDNIRLVRATFSGTPLHINATLVLENPTGISFKLKDLDLSLRAAERLLGSASLLRGPYELGPKGQAELSIDVALHEDAVGPATTELLGKGALVGEARGSALVEVAGLEMAIAPLVFSFDVDVPMEMSVEPLDVRVEGADILATLEARLIAGPFSGPLWMSSCSSLVRIRSPGGGRALGLLSLSAPSELLVGGTSIIDVVLKPDEEGLELVAEALVAGTPLDLQLLNTSARISVLGVGPIDVEIQGPVNASVQMGFSYDIALRVLDLWPIEPGDTFFVMAQLNITMASPISNQISIRNATFELYNTTGFYLGNGSLNDGLVLPSANGTFSLNINSTFWLREVAVGWVVQELLDEGSLELVLRSVRASVDIGAFSMSMDLPDMQYAYEPGEVGFDVEDVELVEFDAEEGVVVFDVYVSIFNPFSFVVNLSRGPNNEPSLFFEFWCQECDVFLGYGRYEREAMLLPRAETLIVVRVDLTPEGAWHVISKHYQLWPPPPRIRMKAAVRNGIAFIRIYEVLVRVRFEREDVQVDEPVFSAASPSVYPCLEEIGHLHEGPPGLWAPQPFYGLLGLLRQLLHEPPGLIEGARLDQDGAYLIELIPSDIWRAEDLKQPGP